MRHDPDVASYRLRAERRLPEFVPGQFIHLAIDDYDPARHWPASRAFSVACSVADRQTIDLTISRQGGYTSRVLDELREGDRVWAKGPYGEFTISEAPGLDRAVLIAGGTGVTPFCAFLDAGLAAGRLPVESVDIFYGARRPDLLIYRALVERCQVELPGFRAHLYVEEAGGDAGVLPGRLSLPAIVTELGDLDRAAFYISGPKPMIDSFVRGLGERGVCETRLKVDAWE